MFSQSSFHNRIVNFAHITWSFTSAANWISNLIGIRQVCAIWYKILCYSKRKHKHVIHNNHEDTQTQTETEIETETVMETENHKTNKNLAKLFVEKSKRKRNKQQNWFMKHRKYVQSIQRIVMTVHVTNANATPLIVWGRKCTTQL